MVWDVEYDIYGKVRTLSKGNKDFIPFRNQGQYEDVEVNLFYNRYRYYSPESGTYISQDPIRLEGSDLNLYSYVFNSNAWTDALGLMAWLFGKPKPKGWKIAKNGSWDGKVGHSNFIPNNPSELGIANGSKIPYKNGTPDFGKWAERTFDVSDMTGVHTTDMPLIHKRMAELYPKEFKNQTAAKNWLSDMDLIAHHFQGTKVQIVPSKLHNGVRHSGSASSMRNSCN